MKTHWQRTHAVEWDIASLSASSGSRSLLSTFRTPRLFCGSKAKNPRDHSVKCASMFQLLAMRTLRENGITTPLPSRGPALKQSQTEPKYQRFDIAKTSLGRFFKPSAGHESDAGSSLGRTAVVVATTSKSDHVTEFLPPAPAALPTHWLGCLVLGNPAQSLLHELFIACAATCNADLGMLHKSASYASWSLSGLRSTR